MKYVPPFDLVKRSAQIYTQKGETKYAFSQESFLRYIKLFVASVDVDEQWYLRQYEDVARAVDGGSIKSAKEHFINSGYFEGRLPCPLAVDEGWYLQQYPDVAAGVKNGTVASAQRHFMSEGYREGRLPFGD